MIFVFRKPWMLMVCRFDDCWIGASPDLEPGQRRLAKGSIAWTLAPDLMSSAYSQLLDATIAHLETLKNRGVSWVPVRRETLASIASVSQKPAPSLSSREAGRTVRPTVLDSSNSSVSRERSAAVPPIAASVTTPVRSEAALSRWSKAAAVAIRFCGSKSIEGFSAVAGTLAP